ncbi:hypothetical protein [Kitasatospora kifunensis]|uniref:Uncharacterized protein n=1 Tax=Kitasatospora kifunensis TaxID=58351 RepID=A0A7W7VVZ8_KITKI|nr:hypothetical protein [Kitasatospora kifunensis]MBB4924931.1 hypothetical protein [Kitasatospora kifunensis]
MTETSSAPFQAHKWLEHHAVAMNAVETGLISLEELVTVRVPITITRVGPAAPRTAARVLMTPFYRLPDGWLPPTGR